MVTWSCLGFLSELVPTSTSLAWNLTASPPSKNMGVVLYCFPCLSENWYFEVGDTYIGGHLCLRCYFAFVLPILEYCTPVWGELLNFIFSFLSARCQEARLLDSGQSDQALPWSEFIVVVSSTSCLWGFVCCTRLVWTRITVCSASFHLLLIEFGNRAAAAAHPLEYKVSRCITSQFERCFLPAQVRMWNDLPYTVFDTGTLFGFNGSVSRCLLPWVLYSSLFRGAGACGVAKAIDDKLLCFSRLGLCCWF